ncbi:hypothetical protein BGX27_010557 [Mortierella sp. AM989]|nr:hypothetical protein BGX27_010557 [Mortierella sp. AM989]
MTCLISSVSPLDITEVLQTIVSMLDPASQVAATLVSHHWYNCCSPILWSTITNSDWTLPHFSPRQLYGHAHFVRSLEWHSVQTNFQLLYPQLDHLHFDVYNKDITTIILGAQPNAKATISTTEDTFREQPSLVCLSKIVGRCTNLQDLCFHAERDGIHVETIQAIQSLRFLQSLELYANKVVADQESMRSTMWLLSVQDLVNGLPQLKKLVLRGSAFCFQSPPEIPQGIESDVDREDHQAQPETEVVEGEVSCAYNNAACSTNERGDERANPNLELLFLKPSLQSLPIEHLSIDTAISESELTLLLQQCPLLESLDLPGGIGWEWSDDFIRSVAESCPYLQAFFINASCYPPVADERLSALIKGLPPMRRFGARACQVGDHTLLALEEKCPELEKLDISLAKGHQLSKAKLYEYLRHAKNLIHLEAEAVWILLQDLQVNEVGQNEDQPHEQGEEGAGQEGAGTHHQEVEATTSTTSTADQTVGQAPCGGWASQRTLQYLAIGFTSHDRSIHQCSDMYSLLAKLTNLNHLQLSYTCLDFSYESGFHQLASLRELRTFSIETCGYTALKREDLVWMVTAWPKLERIHVNLPGASKERQFQAWLKEANREDVAIKSRQPLVYF